MDKHRFLRQFIQRTGLEPEAAADILSQTEWDLVESYRMFDNLVKLGKIKPTLPANASRMGPPPAGMVGEIVQVYVGGEPAFIGGLSQANGGRAPYGPPGQFGSVGVRYGVSSVPHQQPVERIIPIQVEKARAFHHQPPAGRTQTPTGQPMAARMQNPSHCNQQKTARPVSDVGPQIREHHIPASQAEQFRGSAETDSGPGVQQARAMFQGQQGMPATSTSNQRKPGPTGVGTAPVGRGSVPTGMATRSSTGQGRVNENYPTSQTRMQNASGVAGSQNRQTPAMEKEDSVRPHQNAVGRGTGTGRQVNSPGFGGGGLRPVSEVIPGTGRQVGGVTHPVSEMIPGKPKDTDIKQGGDSMSQSKPNGSSTPPSTGNKEDNSNQLQTPTKQAPASPRPLKRGFSKIVENESLVNETRNSLLHDIEEHSHDHMYVQTFILPDLTVYSSDFRAFLEKDLIETSTLVSLEQAGRLNWWAEMGICNRLLPMATSGDGNCLLHAGSLAMWGIHDRQLMLRKALHDILTRQNLSQNLYRRWRWQQTQLNKESGLIFSEEEWQQEWNGILKLASTMPRSLPGMNRRNSSCCDSPLTQGDSNPVVYESLEEFHVFVLAHVLQRAVIVVADTMLKDSSGDALAPIPFGGVYLPLECDSKTCYKSPLLLTYDAAHFSALVPMEKQNSSPEDKSGLPVAIPLVAPDLKLLPLHFMVDPGLSYDWKKSNNTEGVNLRSSPEDKTNVLQQYLDMEKLPVTNWDDNDSDVDRRSTGSYESDDNLGCIGKEKKKEGKMSQQLQSMTKQFGSLGKSMGKKLKKNFGNVGKALKAMGPDSDKSRKVSIGGGVTQSTKVPMTIAAMSDQEQMYVWCAKINVRQTDMHKSMIKNYLHDSQDRFKEEGKLMRARGEEIRRRSIGHYADPNQLTKCVNTECNMYGNPETCYLCSKCYSQQKHAQQALDQEKQGGKYLVNIMSQSTGKIPSDSIQKCGKSKFYLSPDEAPDDDDAFLPQASSRPPSQVSSQGTSSRPSSQVMGLSQHVMNKPPSQVSSQGTSSRPSSQVMGSSPHVMNKPPSQGSGRPASQVLTQRCPSPKNGSGQKVHIDVLHANKLGANPAASRERTPSPDYDNVDYDNGFGKKSVPRSPALQPKTQNKDANTRTSSEAKACRTPGCAFFGVASSEFYCSACYKAKLSRDNQKTRL